MAQSNFDESFQCTMDLYSKIYFINTDENISDVELNNLFKKNNCPISIQKAVYSSLVKLDGALDLDQLKNSLILKDLNYKVNLIGEDISIYQLNDEIKKLLNLNPNFLVEIKKLYSSARKFIALDKNDEIKLTCEDCNSLGKKMILLTLNEKETQKTWIEVNIENYVQVYRAVQSMGIYDKELKEEQFEIAMIKTINADEYFNHIDEIKFYLLTKPITKGEYLKRDQLRKKTLVRNGEHVKIALKNAGIKLSTYGVAQESGQYGDFIKFMNPKSHKFYQGKIIDFNNAVIEL